MRGGPGAASGAEEAAWGRHVSLEARANQGLGAGGSVTAARHLLLGDVPL